jgi:hypothetical protein
MAVILILLAVTLLMCAWMVVWAYSPRLREWIEAPKYSVLMWEERFPRAEEAPRPVPRSTTATADLAAGKDLPISDGKYEFKDKHAVNVVLRP